MKHRILKVVAALLLVSFFASCFHPIKTDRRYPSRHKYRKAGRAW